MNVKLRLNKINFLFFNHKIKKQQANVNYLFLSFSLSDRP
ncbi:Uncharacterized protein YR821_1680 [Yersinia ruckeri]|uniref:Uncharacterized protein n=1 Tax=Yersinia ruckeri TaxID=29486 RepID=A0A0A8VGJ6_YERRU|nr:hypothetical protein yruck0001_15300 [Yersinia ruckeri ATCC 29473]QTD76604.1 Uncharacterized protein YR821_1680 [Yersinia ruckeri]CEK27503.1 hypothetical protein CSF007_8750 [Yersinia ruckeri]